MNLATKFRLERNQNPMIKIKVAILALSCIFYQAAFAQNEDCYPPKPNRLVVDVVNILTDAEENALEAKLLKLNEQTSNQVVIVTIAELCAGDAAMTAYEIGKRWGVGQKDFDNGIVILVKPTGSAGDRKAFIATGRGLEGAIPDATAFLIVDQEMIPEFRNENYYAGLDKAVTVISELATGEYNSDAYTKKNSGSPGFAAIIPFLIVIGIWFLLFYKRTNSYARTNNLGFWAALALMGASNRGHGGHFGGFRSGGGGFGGGGFGGFGGGSFGGGGAGGSW